MRSRLLFAALCRGVFAGMLDIGAAALLNSVSPLVVLLSIASGILGKAAYHAGLAGVALGLGLQWMMSSIAALIYLIGGRLLPLSHRSWVASGILYGLVVFFVMNDVVVPLSAAVPKTVFTPLTFTGNLLANIVFGLIIAFAVHRFGERGQGLGTQRLATIS